MLERVVMRRKEVRAEGALHARMHVHAQDWYSLRKPKGLPKVRSRTFKGHVQK